jgi:cytochrome c oxidase subunit 4
MSTETASSPDAPAAPEPDAPEIVAHDEHGDPIDPHHDDPEHGDHGHGASDFQYIIIAAVLAGLTALEVALSYLDAGPFFIPLLLILMAIKFVTVVSFFMHLKFDNRLFSWLFYTGLFLAIFVYIVALSTFHFFG